ncbi:MAG: GFA family protein [Pseudomonadota bacterium]
MTMRTGECLCGAITLKAEISGTGIGACHCTQCQRWTGGGPLLSVRIDGLEMQGEDHINEFRLSDWGVRAFCRDCGSTLYWRMADGPIRHIAVGLLHDQSGLRLNEEIFVDYRPDWLAPIDEATQSTEAEQNVLLKEYLDKKAGA